LAFGFWARFCQILSWKIYDFNLYKGFFMEKKKDPNLPDFKAKKKNSKLP
jgi:hypothetical protein